MLLLNSQSFSCGGRERWVRETVVQGQLASQTLPGQAASCMQQGQGLRGAAGG